MMTKERCILISVPERNRLGRREEVDGGRRVNELSKEKHEGRMGGGIRFSLW